MRTIKLKGHTRIKSLLLLKGPWLAITPIVIAMIGKKSIILLNVRRRVMGVVDYNVVAPTNFRTVIGGTESNIASLE